MQQRRGTSEQWTLANPILAPGEIGFATDDNRFKIGDGINRWLVLPYFINSESLPEIDLSNYVTTEDLTDAVAAIPAPDYTGLATETYVGTAVSTAIGNLVDTAPAALDTLNELAAALNDDANFATTVTDAIAEKANSENPELTVDLEISWQDPIAFEIGFRKNNLGFFTLDAISTPFQIALLCATITFNTSPRFH